MTFLRVNFASIGLILGTDQVKVEASLPQGLTLSSNDLATLSYQKANHVRLPRAQVRCLLRDASAGDSWLETASVTLDLNVDTQLSVPGWQEARNKQLSFIQAEDRATRRIPFAYERLRGRGNHFIIPYAYVLVSSLLSDAAYSYHGPVVLRHLTVPGWRSGSNRDTRPPPNTTSYLHQQTSFESIDDTGFSTIDSDTRLAYVNDFGIYLAVPLVFHSLSRPVSPYPNEQQFDGNQNQTDDSEGPSSSESSEQSDGEDPFSSIQGKCCLISRIFPLSNRQTT